MEINVLCTIDKNYFNQYKTLVASILGNANSPKKINLLLAAKDLSENQKEEISKFVLSYGAKINYLKKPDTDFSEYSHREHMSEVTHYRTYYLSKLDAERVLYLDPDIVVLSDLEELFQTNLGKFSVGAVKDYAIGLRHGKDYYNAGVLLVDTKKWNKRSYTKKCIEYLEKNHEILTCHNQDTMNTVLDGDIKEIDLKWNRQKWIYDVRPSDLGISRKKYNYLIKDPKIIHYTGRLKPWHYRYLFPDKKHYANYAKKAKVPVQEDSGPKTKDVFWKIARWIMYKSKSREMVAKLPVSLKRKIQSI